MKLIILIAVSVFLATTIASSFIPAYAAAQGAMSGRGDWATRGYNQAAKEKQKGAPKVTKKPTQ